MSGHAKGPWEVAPRIGRYQVIPATEQERQKLASINALEFEALSVGAPNGQMALIPLDESNLANAKLIAAAPEMLEALEAITNEYAREMDTLRSIEEDDLPEVVAARAAIAKARGEV